LFLVFTAVSNLLISSLVGFLLLIVYVGAVIVLFGYICSVCPNANLSSSFSPTILIFALFFSLVSPFYLPTVPQSSGFTLFFFSSSGLFLTLMLLFLLLVILLSVTSHFSLKRGPFRSL
jgi:NADH:ubiquinone oxidoreductase subunit 6 (subunit J)